jgi:hypothetical protein
VTVGLDKLIDLTPGDGGESPVLAASDAAPADTLPAAADRT